MSDQPQDSAKRSLLPILIGVLCLVVVASFVTFFLRGRSAAAEAEASQQLKDMGALVVRRDERTESLALGLPGIQDRLDEAMPIVPKLIYLKSLNASKTSISDDHLAYVGSLSNLTDLQLAETPITDVGIEHLSGLTKVESLYLTDTAITSAGLPAIGKLDSLKVLGIGGTKISGNLEPLTQLAQLELLVVSNLNFSDDDVQVLVRIPKLRRLTLNGATVSAEGLEKLRDNIANVD